MTKRKPCYRRDGRRKIAWPNAATAAWYNTQLGNCGIRPYHCPDCGRWHNGRPRGKRRYAGIHLALWIRHSSIAPYGDQP